MIATSLSPFSCVVSLLAEAQPYYEANRISRKDESVTKKNYRSHGGILALALEEAGSHDVRTAPWNLPII